MGNKYSIQKQKSKREKKSVWGGEKKLPLFRKFSVY